MINVTEHEQTVLGSFFLEPELIKETRLTEEHFQSPGHQRLMKAMLDMDMEGKPIDTHTVSSYLATEIQTVGGWGYILKLADSVPTVANFPEYERMVIDHWKQREVSNVAESLRDNPNYNDLLLPSADRLIALSHDDEDEDDDDGHISGVMTEILNELPEQTGELSGIPTGYKGVDELTGGLQVEDLVILAGRPSMGKTAFALNVAQNVVTNTEDVVGIFSLEMSKKALGKRMLSSYGRIDGTRFRTPPKSFSSEDWSRVYSSAGALSSTNLHLIEDSLITVSKIWAKCRRLRQRYPDKRILILIDYIQLITGEGKGKNRQEEVSEISRRLKLMARELEMCVVGLSQLNRGVESRQEKRPVMSDLRESGSLEQDADVIGFLYRDEYYYPETEDKNIVELIIAKQRNGPINTVQMVFLSQFGLFLDLETRYSE